MDMYLKQIITGQFEAALCMLNECVQRCPPEHWEDKIANDSFRQVAYHTLYYVDYYLSPGEQAFALREIHQQGGDERTSAVSPGLSKGDTLAYLTLCRQKMLATLAAESAESLQGPSGFTRLAFSRGELHFYNVRHVQHHVGQLSAFLRRIDHSSESWWVRTGWRGGQFA
jgi:uncharacterized damage-inducible protein DinB